jgi:hypothetical protein
VCSITEEEFNLAEDPQTVIEELPNWQHEAVKLARSIQEQEGKRYLALPDKFDIHEWAIMDSFSETLKGARLRNDFHGGIRGAGAFRLFKRLLMEYNLWDAWNRFKQVEPDGHPMVRRERHYLPSALTEMNSRLTASLQHRDVLRLVLERDASDLVSWEPFAVMDIHSGAPFVSKRIPCPEAFR